MSSPGLLNVYELRSSTRVGCFHCFSLWNLDDIVNWTDRDCTGLCPKCKAPTLVGDSEWPITDHTLKEFHNEYFAGRE